MESIEFTLNGQRITASGFDPHMTLLDFLRGQRLTGSKEGCAEGECGACAVAVVRQDARGRTRYDAVNSCLTLLAAVAGQEIVTVEGVGTRDNLHPVQQGMVELGGSQCGYCTPGFVVSLFAEYYRPGRTGYDPEAISGNLCRCTGYRPIREVACRMPRPDKNDRFQARLASPPPTRQAIAYSSESGRYFRPTALQDALTLLDEYPEARLISGGTDLVVEANLRHARWSTLISLEDVAELRAFESTEAYIDIGAGIVLTELEERLEGQLPIVSDLLPLFSSRLIRNRATLGGNLGNASPIGDSPPALLALDAQVGVASRQGQRWIPLCDFFAGHRKTALLAGELIAKVRIPRPLPTIARFYKVSKRVLDDISTVAAGLALDLDDDHVITKARLAYGGVAATPIRAYDAEKALVGQPWNEATVAKAKTILLQGIQPMSDHRGSEPYRREMVHRLLEKFYWDTGKGTTS